MPYHLLPLDDGLTTWLQGEVEGISPNGRIAVGWVSVSLPFTGIFQVACYWTSASGSWTDAVGPTTVSNPDPIIGENAQGFDAIDDGTFVGVVLIGGGTGDQPYRWTALDGLVTIGSQSGSAAAISTDGSRIVGYASPVAFGFENACYWETGTKTWYYKANISNLGTPAAGFMEWGDTLEQVASTILFFNFTTSDGHTSDMDNILIGQELTLAQTSNLANYQQFTVTEVQQIGSVWWVHVIPAGSGGTGTTNFANNLQLTVTTAGFGRRDLGFLILNDRSAASGVSDDGSVIIGQSFTDFDSRHAHAFRWTATDGMVDLGLPSGVDAVGTFAGGISGDGSLIVGDYSTNTVGGSWMWTEADGFTILPLVAAYTPSGDGRTIIGATLTSEAYMRNGTVVLLGRVPSMPNNTTSLFCVSYDGTRMGGSTNPGGDNSLYLPFIYIPSSRPQVSIIGKTRPPA